MEQLIILLLVALGSGISSYLQKKKKREAEEGERRSGRPVAETPVPHWPTTARDWQEELRRILQGEAPAAPAPPKIPPPPPAQQPVRRRPAVSPRAEPEPSEGTVEFPSPLKESSTAYSRAANLQGRVERRLRAVDEQTTTHPKSKTAQPVSSPGAVVIRRWTRNRESLREAFIASLIFAPPVALAEPRERN